MAEQDICRLVQLPEDIPSKGTANVAQADADVVAYLTFGLIRLRPRIPSWWEARLSTANGEVVIARSNEFNLLEAPTESHKANTYLVAQLARDGWHPMANSGDGLIVSMR